MIQGLSQDITYQLREQAIFAEANAGDITRRLLDLSSRLRTNKPIAKDDVQAFVRDLQNDLLVLMNGLNAIQLELQ